MPPPYLLPLEGLVNTPHTTQMSDIRTKFPILAVEKPSALIQAVGYLKHTRANPSINKMVYCRGQRSLHTSFSPTLYRGLKQENKRCDRDRLIKNFLNKIRIESAFLSAVPEYAREAVLQHYGLQTRWMDVVDNIWVALWFACHQAHTIGRHKEFLHFERRVKKHANDYAYILLLESASAAISDKPGYFEDGNSSTIDLRIACPSHFIRPHAQHGLLVRLYKKDRQISLDFSSLIVGVIRIDLDLALDWLGNGHTLSAHTLFPPPVYDYGYRELLDGLIPDDELLGRIQHIGA